jgi:hypothetical protein
MVVDTPMTILEIEKMCREAEQRIGQELCKVNRYYKVHQCDPLSDEQIKKIDEIMNSNAYCTILNLRSTFE